MKVKILQKRLTELVNELIDIKGYLQDKLPTEDIILTEDDTILKHYTSILNKFKLMTGDSNLSNSKLKKKHVPEQDSVIKSKRNEILILTCRKQVATIINNFKSIKLDVFMTNGLLLLEHYRDIKPELPQKALSGIKIKIEKQIKELIRFIKEKEKKQIFIIGVSKDKVDNLFLQEKKYIEEKINNNVISLVFDDHNQLDETKMLQALKKHLLNS
ncbi:MAG: DUF2100 domain-containing protein [Promethearchaeota archaeon]